MELYHLKTFVAVADEGHLTRAAERLHSSQPAVSSHVKTLEEELGVSLFIRTPKGMRLTGEGEILRDKAMTALSTIDDMRQKAGALKKERAGTVKLGLHIDPRHLRISEFMSFMGSNHPKIDFHLLQKWSKEQPTELRKRGIDAGFIYGAPDQPGLASSLLKKFNTSIARPAAWRDRLRGADWKDVAEMPWVWTPCGCTLWDIASKEFKKRGLKPKKSPIADQEYIVTTLVSSGIGLSFMIEEDARDAVKRGEMIQWGRVVGSIDLMFIYHEKRADSPLLQAVLEGVKAVWSV